MDLPTIVYVVDADNRIVSVNEAWDDFAAENNGISVLAERVIGRNLFEFITDPSTQHIYRQMLARIRGGIDLRFSYRCDSPDCRRLMEMQVRGSDAQGGVEFRSITLEAHSREPLHLPQADGGTEAEPETLQRACGWCNRLEVDGVWMEIEDAVTRLRMMERHTAPMVTHGMCADCLAKMEAELWHEA